MWNLLNLLLERVACFKPWGILEYIKKLVLYFFQIIKIVWADMEKTHIQYVYIDVQHI